MLTGRPTAQTVNNGVESLHENDEVSVVSDSNELLNGGEDEDVAHDDPGAGLVGELRCKVGHSACQ